MFRLNLSKSTRFSSGEPFYGERSECKVPSDSTGDEISVSTEGNDRLTETRANRESYPSFAPMVRHENRDRFARLGAVSDYD